MNINEYNKNKNSQNNNQNNTNNRKKKKKFRFDKLIGYITIITIIVFMLMIYNDYKNVAKANNNEEVLADNNDKTSAATITGTKAQTSVTRNKKVVCIDAGHGGTDGGAQFNNYSEKDQTLEISKLVQKELEAQGIKVVMTRTTDETISLENRLDIAKKANAGIIVSIHRNYYENSSSVNGVEAWIHSAGPADAKSLAGDILTQLTKINGVTNRGIKTGTMANAKSNYYMNSDSPCTSCIIELGFISNAADNTLVTTNKSQCAKSIAQGILNYINEVEK
jgi:N-acetylmuramoyl-L-alanine amidase